jgi:predicted nucleotidyltransferase
MDKEQALKIAKKYKEIVAEKLPLKAVYLYGSYSKGNYTEGSDIDIAVVVDKLNDNFFEDTPLLWKLRRKISLMIEPVLITEDESNPLYYDIIRTGTLV